ncbi:hypothetical protein ACG1BZ_17310 [Microbulbifer sp. CNSA002]|uniref:hypothetical protein n=1 Tax=Microbulbifer sp. CNSA002 TaxID=3373604 RepID=UPI0039B5A441
MIVILRILRGIIGFVGANDAVRVVLSILPSPGGTGMEVSPEEMLIKLLVSVVCLSVFLYSRRIINQRYQQQSNKATKQQSNKATVINYVSRPRGACSA